MHATGFGMAIMLGLGGGFGLPVGMLRYLKIR